MAEEETPDPSLSEEAAEIQQTKENTEVTQETEDYISKANVAAERLEKANKVMSANLARQEKLKVQETLGGQASAGTPTVSDEDRKNASAEKLLVGTGYEGMLTRKDV